MYSFHFSCIRLRNRLIFSPQTNRNRLSETSRITCRWWWTWAERERESKSRPQTAVNIWIFKAQDKCCPEQHNWPPRVQSFQRHSLFRCSFLLFLEVGSLIVVRMRTRVVVANEAVLKKNMFVIDSIQKNQTFFTILVLKWFWSFCLTK